MFSFLFLTYIFTFPEFIWWKYSSDMVKVCRAHTHTHFAARFIQLVTSHHFSPHAHQRSCQSNLIQTIKLWNHNHMEDYDATVLSVHYDKNIPSSSKQLFFFLSSIWCLYSIMKTLKKQNNMQPYLLSYFFFKCNIYI